MWVSNITLAKPKYAAIRYTEPFLNNQHIVQPTVCYLKHLAKVTSGARGPIRWWDAEGNAIMTRSTPLSSRPPRTTAPAAK